MPVARYVSILLMSISDLSSVILVIISASHSFHHTVLAIKNHCMFFVLFHICQPRVFSPVQLGDGTDCSYTTVLR